MGGAVSRVAALQQAFWAAACRRWATASATAPLAVHRPLLPGAFGGTGPDYFSLQKQFQSGGGSASLPLPGMGGMSGGGANNSGLHFGGMSGLGSGGMSPTQRQLHSMGSAPLPMDVGMEQPGAGGAGNAQLIGNGIRSLSDQSTGTTAVRPPRLHGWAVVLDVTCKRCGLLVRLLRTPADMVLQAAQLISHSACSAASPVLCALRADARGGDARHGASQWQHASARAISGIGAQGGACPAVQQRLPHRV